MSRKVKIILVLITLLISSLFIVKEKSAVYYKSYSPDGQYSRYAKVTVSIFSFLHSYIPFAKFSDQKGRAYVYDELKDEIVGSASLTMISNVKETSWEEDCLSYKANFSIKLPRKISAFIIKEYQQSTVVNKTRTLYIDNKKYIINNEKNRLTIKNNEGVVLLEDIRCVFQIDDKTLQILKDNLDIAYYDSSLNLLEEPIGEFKKNYNVCGNVSTYSFKIEEDNEYYNLNVATGFTSYEFSNYETLYSLKKEGIKNVYFFNKEQKLEYDDNSLKLNHLVIDYGKYFGILNPEKGIQYFDSIDISSKPMKVMRDNLYGYYDITAVKYLEIGPFIHVFAEFKGEKNTKGYIDYNGKEYFKY